MDLQRVLRNTPATLSVTFYADETTTDADASVAVTVKKADGTTLTSGTATHVGIADSGQYSFNLAAQANLNALSIDWTGTFDGAAGTVTTMVEIVGGHLFTIAELRGTDTVLSDTDKYPMAKLVEARLRVETEFERITGRAFFPRFAREDFTGEGSDWAYLNHPEPSKILTVNGVAAQSDSYEFYNVREIRCSDDYFVYGTRYTIEYEYGMATVPADVKQAALRRARGLLVSGRARIDERATMMQIPDFGTFNLATPGRSGSVTGIPDIDVVLDAYTLGGGIV